MMLLIPEPAVRRKSNHLKNKSDRFTVWIVVLRLFVKQAEAV